MLEADVTVLDGLDDTVTAGACDIEVVGFQGKALAHGWAIGGAKGDVAPPDSVVPPEVVIGVVGRIANFEACGGGCLG